MLDMPSVPAQGHTRVPHCPFCALLCLPTDLFASRHKASYFAGLESLGNLLDPMEQEIILTWVSLCFITADLMGLQHPKSARPTFQSMQPLLVPHQSALHGSDLRGWRQLVQT